MGPESTFWTHPVRLHHSVLNDLVPPPQAFSCGPGETGYSTNEVQFLVLMYGLDKKKNHPSHGKRITIFIHFQQKNPLICGLLQVLRPHLWVLQALNNQIWHEN